MWSNTIENDNEVWFRDITGLNIADEYIPIFIGVVTITVLFLLVLVAYILWRCCVSKSEVKKPEVIHVSTIEKSLSNNTNYSTFGIDAKKDSYSSGTRVVELIPEYDNSVHWLYGNHLLSEVPSPQKEKKPIRNTSSRKHSQDRIDARSFLNKSSKSHSRSVMLSPVLSLDDYSLPKISQFSPQPYSHARNIFLDDHYSPSNDFNNFRTRSLPSCVRFKRHSPGHTDGTAELYDKVNFSKKRKNRMRNDEAAIIALSKSRSQFFNKDTDSLVDNEAVIVYDERTAL